ncbi:Leucine Rich Repeat family protein [Trichomonas vaginalis G3]|uniref:Leucine Rich Repeat family protein n=1 Tax=Trichomonas vaginalis (strain ATCC PRA-98 / G3) TaxID=412133 RepID=A2DH31_TRIV3|nr:uncharacterized protein TVAGG3_0341430 [Trichomonas vaginalis G3]EAY20341.1 Leucine Rich Repeat family protein [Trichomonas vaginalis G3]KAI5530669.1 leucine-rich repeat, isoform f-related family [Trichomonas vaginalis G3]|eukprot:XP_001581327.1 hypothetical protein [Trichomonas vaginalis G3]
MEKVRHSARNFHEQKGKFVIFSAFGKVKKTFGSKDVVIVLHDGGAALWDKKCENGPFLYGSWITLQSLNIDNDKITLSFRNKDSDPTVLEFETTDSKFAFGAIGDILQHVLYGFEQESLKLSKFKFSPSRPTTMSIMSRLIERAETEKMKITGDQIDKIEDIFEISRPAFNLSDIPDVQNILIAVFDIIPMTSFIRELIIPNLDFPTQYRILSILLQQAPSIYHLTFTGEANNRIEFFESLNPNSINLTSLSFIDTNIKIPELNKLSTINSTANFNYISFQNALSAEALDFLYNGYLSASLPNLISLNLDNTKNLSFDKIANQISKLKMLSVANCNIEIGSALDLLTTNAPELRFLNMSSNSCENIKKKLKLPPKLSFMSFGDVSWKPGTLVSLLKIIFEEIPDNSKLDLSDAHVDDEEWPSVFNFLAKQNGMRLQNFYWSNNKISPELCTFFDNFPNLVVLYMSGVLSESSLELVNQFSVSLQKMTNLKTLKLTGTDTVFLGTQGLASISKAFASLTNLEYLDLSGNKIRDEGFSTLSNTLSKCTNMKTFVCDNNDLENPESLVNFCKLYPYPYSFPLNDINKFESIKKIHNSQVNEVCKSNRTNASRMNFLSLLQSDADINSKYPKPAKNPLDSPSNVYYYEFCSPFPNSISKEFGEYINSLGNPTKTPYPNKQDSEENFVHQKPRRKIVSDTEDDDDDEAEKNPESDSSETQSSKKQEFKLRSNWGKSITFDDSDTFVPKPRPEGEKRRRLYSDAGDKPFKCPIPKIPRPAKESVHASKKRTKHPDISDDSDSIQSPEKEDQMINVVKPKVKQVIVPSLDGFSSSNESTVTSEDEEDETFEPKEADWSFPLRYVPPPQDTEKIVRNLGDKYSLGSLLTAVKRS